MSKQLIAVQTSGPALERKSESAPAFFGKVERKTLDQWQALPLALQIRAEQIIRDHVHASNRVGCGVENMNRVVIEAMEMAEIEARNPALADGNWERTGPMRKYDVYVSPINN